MGTSGTCGFRIDGTDKVTYSQSDTYPSGMGLSLLTELQGETLEHLKEVARGIELVEQGSTPTLDQVDACFPYSNVGVSTRSVKDWYCLFRHCHGTLKPWLKEGLTFMLDSHVFLKDSLFCEYAYIINLDNGGFEVYFGFVYKNDDLSKTAGRYVGDEPREGYYGVSLVKVIPLEQVFTMTDGDRAVLVEELEGMGTPWKEEDNG